MSNTQTAGGEKDTIEEIAYGSYDEKNGKQYIIYRTETEGEESVSSILILDGDSLTIKRRGHTNSSIVYSAGKKHAFPYVTPYGTIDMEIETARLVSDLTAEGGTIELVYLLKVQEDTYHNDMKIKVIKR